MTDGTFRIIPLGDDYGTTQDYNPADAEWIEGNFPDPEYQVQLDLTTPDHFRYRLRFQPDAWKKGLPDAG